ncbi:MAG: hypothetical protein IJ879_10685 [Muribaculaceae bacterium]|nr:hypothetical protein [Muribaculaceae bacterium]
MKKLLFTLSALLVGFAASAFNLEMRFVDDNGNPINEINAAPGNEVVVHMQITAIDGVVTGHQMQFYINDPEGNHYATNGNVIIKAGKANRFGPEGMSTALENATSTNVNPADADPGAYRALGTNTSTNLFWNIDPQVYIDAWNVMNEDEATALDETDYTEEMITPGNVYRFVLSMKADWADEYAMLDFDETFGKFALSDGGQFMFPADFTGLDLKIINDDYVAPGLDQLAGEIIIGDADENGYVTVEYTGPEDVTIKVMVDGVYVPLTDGKVFLGAYGESEITVEVTAEGYEPLTATKTVNWEEPAVQTPAPEIVVTEGEDAYTFLATGEGTVTLFVDNVEVENPYVVNRTDVDQVLNITAVAHVDGQTDGVTSGEYIVPALVTPQLPDLEGNITVSEPDENGNVTITYDGTEDVTILVNGEPYEDGYQLQPGENTLVITVTADGYNTLEETVVVVWDAPQPPYETPAPVVEVVTNEHNVVVTATGEGTVIIYVNYFDGNGPVAVATGEGEATYTIEGGEEVMYVGVWATAQANDEALVGISDTQYVEVPAGGGVGPEDPHMVGKWIVIIDKYGEEHWYAMTPDAEGDPNWSFMLTLHHNPWGDFAVPFYFMVDGVRMGAETDMYEPQMGTAENTILNPVFESENLFTVPGTFTYTWGLQFKDGQYYLLVAQGPQTGINELVDGKTVAGVRYFNMAGQEMQEANGMTIVVTTYTDGTTTTTKVMK